MLILNYKLPARMLLTSQHSTLRLRRITKNSYESYDLETKHSEV